MRLGGFCVSSFPLVIAGQARPEQEPLSGLTGLGQSAATSVSAGGQKAEAREPADVAESLNLCLTEECSAWTWTRATATIPPAPEAPRAWAGASGRSAGAHRCDGGA